MDLKANNIIKNLIDQRIIVIAGDEIHMFQAKTDEQFYQFVQAINSVKDKTVDNIRDAIIHCIDGVPTYIRKRVDTHTVSALYKAENIFHGSVIKFREDDQFFMITDAVLVGFELGREYERKVTRTIKALNNTRLRKKPRIRANMSKRRERFNALLPLNYQRIKPIPTTKAIKL